MKRSHIYLFAAALAASAISLHADIGPGNIAPKSPSDNLQQLGSTLADEKTARDVQAMLARVVNDGLTESRFEFLLANLAKSDRERIGNFKNQKLDDLNRVIAQFRADFKAKYNQDFDFRPELLKDAVVYAGKDKNSATVSLPEITFLGKSKSADTPPKTAPTSAAPAKLITGNTLTLNLINEGSVVSAWRIDIPEEITGNQLKANLIKHIQMLDDQNSTWPADPATTCHAAAYHVLQSLTESNLATER